MHIVQLGGTLTLYPVHMILKIGAHFLFSIDPGINKLNVIQASYNLRGSFLEELKLSRHRSFIFQECKMEQIEGIIEGIYLLSLFCCR